MTHHLFDSLSDKIVNITLSGDTISTESGKVERTRTTSKQFPTKKEAAVAFVKKEWETLKKGFVFRNNDAKKGEPFLHYYVGSGYTGCLSFQDTPEGVYIYKHGWYNSPKDQKDFLVLISRQGELQETIALPKILAWDIQYNSATDSLLLDLDHSIFQYILADGLFSQLEKRKAGQTSFISIKADKIAFATNETLFVADGQNNVLFKQPYKTQSVNGSTPFCAQLSEKGHILALHTMMGEIQLLDTLSGKQIAKIKGDFGMIDRMAFADSDKLLVVKEEYEAWRVRYFDLVSNTEVSFKTLRLPAYSQEVDSFCFNTDQSKLILIQKTTAHVYDFLIKSYLHSFQIDHAVKMIEPKFVGEKLGFRTDYGCFSLYNV